MSYQIKFEPSGITCTDAAPEETLLQIAQRSGENIAADCGGASVCGKCRIRIVGDAHVSPMTDRERSLLSETEREKGVRLACMTRPTGDLTLEIPKENRIADQIVLSKGKMEQIPLSPMVRAVTVTLSRPTLEDNRDDWTRLRDALQAQNAFAVTTPEIDLAVLRNLSKLLRKGRWTVTAMVWAKKKLIGVFPQADVQPYGVAVDIGTTTVAAFLCNLQTGKTCQTASVMNPQVRFGDDVIARISYCMYHEDGLERLHRILMEELSQQIEKMAQEENISTQQIAETVLVGNPVMEHIAFCIPPNTIGLSPFAAAVSDAMEVSARELGLSLMDGAVVHGLPAEAGFVGADNVAVLIAEQPYRSAETRLIVDIGTNSEICFGNAERLFVTSCATGPALEGAQIQCGMRAANGAIAHVQIASDTLEPTLEVLGGKTPLGICGSGIIDAVAQMAKAGILEPGGKFAPLCSHPRIRQNAAGKMEYVLYFAKTPQEHDVTVTAADVRAVQLAKAALYAGAKLLIQKSGMLPPSKVVLAGAFGSYIDPASVVQLGMLPLEDAARITISGNAAGVGARYALLNADRRLEAQRVAKQAVFLETAATMEFQREFAAAMRL